MRNFLIALGVCVAVTLGSSSVAFAGLEEGLAAYKRGDYATALKEFRALASEGDAVATVAQANLGVMYEYGQGVTRDYKEAVKLYRKAAEQGYVMAQKNLGVMYEYGQGVTRDYKEAVNWYRKAAEQGYATAQHNLGWMYRTGQGVTQDYKEAMKWYLKAAQQGVAASQSNLAVLYLRGQGVTQDNIQAHMWFNIGAKNGHEKAKKGRDYVEKQMTATDISTARKLAEEWMAKHRK
jgi:hypothetical protein